MIPPKEIDVVDRHGGFTSITGVMGYVKATNENGAFVRWERKMIYDQTLRRSCLVLKDTHYGTLESYDEKSFYQNNNNVTKAVYKVKGYRYRVAIWFDNVTLKRIA